MKLEIDGVKLNVEITGNGPALVLLHGFTGSAKSWRALTERLCDCYQVIAIDALGHGESDSPSDSNRYAMAHVAKNFLAVLDALELDKVHLLGYSMGGRMALHIATVASERLRSLILESASPGLRILEERQARQRSDEILAQRLESENLEAFVNYWENIPLFASQKNLPSEVQQRQRHQRLHNNPVGLANSLRGVGTGSQDSLWDALPNLNVLVLLIAGALDEKYTKIGREMANLLPNAILEICADCGHTVHIEKPELFYSLVSNFLSKL